MVVVVGGIGLERHDVIFDEAARAQADIFDLGREGEVHGGILASNELVAGRA